MDSTVFAKRLKEAREAKGWKQKTLAKAIGAVPQTISGYEKTDGSKPPSIELAIKIAENLEVSLDWLFGLPEKKKSDGRRYGTIGDIAKALDDIMVCVGAEVEVTTYTHEVVEQGFEYYDQRIEEQVIPCAKIRFKNSDLDSFLRRREKMHSLLRDGTIDFDLYNSWIVGEVEKLKKISSSPFADLADDDGDLPV